MTARTTGIVLATSLVLACGPANDDPPIDCDADAVPLIEFGAREMVHEVARLGDRVVVGIHVSDEDIVADEAYSTRMDRIVASDGCGAEPAVLAAGVARVEQPENVTLPWFVTHGDDAVESGSWLLDVETGARHRIDEEPAQFVAWLDDGLVVERHGGSGELVALFVDDVGTVVEETLHPDLDVARHFSGSLQRVVGGTTEDGELIAIDPRTRMQQHIADDVRDATVVDPDARILFISRLSENLDSNLQAVDRETGREVTLAPAGSDSYSLAWNRSMAVVPSEDPSHPQTKIVLLPELRELNLDGRWSPGSSASDGTRVLNSENGVYILRPGSEQPELLGAGSVGAVIGGQIYGYPVTPGAWPPRLWRAEIDGSGLVDLLGDGSLYGTPIPLGADRWAYSDADGDLILRDRASGTVERLATDVWPNLDLQSPHAWSDVDLVRDEVLFIREDGPRGLWRARVPR